MTNRVHNFDEVYDRRGSDCKKYNPGRFAEDVLPMWIADTDFRVPEPVIEAARKRASHEAFGYPYELPAFNTAVKSWMQRRHQWDISEQAVEFVTGVVPAAIFAIRELTRPGDFIALMTPLYSPLQEAVRDNGRYIAENKLIETDGYFTIDFEDLEKQLAHPRTTMLILCNPHNPVGRVFTKDELLKIGELCLKHHVWVFSDEIHADIVFSGHKHIPFASLSAEFSDITITSLNPGKSFNVAGVRTAAVIIENQQLMERFIVSRKNNKAMGRTVFGQNIFIACYEHCEYYIDQEIPYIERNIDYVKQFIDDNIPEINFIKPEATYLLWLDCRSLQLPQNELITLFEVDGKLGLNNGADFGEAGEGHVRMNVAVPRATVEEGCRRLLAAIESYRQKSNA